MNFQPLAAGDMVSLNGSNLVINLAVPLSGNNNKIKVAESTLKDAAGNIPTTEVVTSNLATVAPPPRPATGPGAIPRRLVTISVQLHMVRANTWP